MALGGGCCSNTLGMAARCREEQVGDTVGSHACEEEVPEVVGEVGWLVCPLVLVWRRVEEVDIRVDEQEHTAVVTITL